MGRIAAVCDVFDALTSDRVYKKASPIEEAIDIMKQGSGKHFDARLLDLFFDSLDEITLIRQEYVDK